MDFSPYPAASPTLDSEPSVLQAVLVYAGPTVSLRPDAISTLNDRWAWMPKADGVYCTVTTDLRGQVSSLLYRSGEPVNVAEADGLIGQYVGLPDAVIVGELEAQTESAIRARNTRGFPVVHLFDAARIAGRSIASAPFAERYGWLHRWQAHVECYEPDAATADYVRRCKDGVLRDVLGRYCTPSKGALRRVPILPLRRGATAGRDLWDSHVTLLGGEGLVACRLDAPLGARGSKKKCRAFETLDCTVASVGNKAAILTYRGIRFVVSAAGKSSAGMQPGDVVEVKANGWTEGSSIPKHARIVRIRHDIGGALERR